MSSLFSTADRLFLLTEPSWEDPVRIRYTIESDQSEGRTGLQTRTPLFLFPRLRQAASYLLTDAEYDELRQALAQLGGRRVVVPLWPDFYRDRSEWIHRSSTMVQWNESSCEILLEEATVSMDNVSPVMTGLIKSRPSVIRHAADAWGVTIEIEEDSQWDQRVGFGAGVTPDTFIFEPDADTIKELSRDQIRVRKVGDGRLSGIAGRSGKNRWGQEGVLSLVDAEIGEFLRFWHAHQGAVKSFLTPSWSQPGADRPATPHNYQATLEKDLIELVYHTPRLATTTVRMWQELPSEGLQSTLARGYGYKLWHEQEEDAVFLTSWEHQLVSTGQVFAPDKISHSGLRLTLKPLGDEAQVEIHLDAAVNPLLPIYQGDAERKLWVTITKFLIDDAGAVVKADELFTGVVHEVELNDERLVGSASAWGGMFGRKLPRFQEKKECNYHLCDGCCGLAKADWLRPGVLAEGTEDSAAVLFTPDAPDVGAYVEKWYAKGWLEVVGTDGARRKRAILDCSHSSGSWVLHLNRPLPVSCLGQRATAFTGCDLLFETCAGKFNNAINHGGAPRMTNFISTSTGVSATKAK